MGKKRGENEWAKQNQTKQKNRVEFSRTDLPFFSHESLLLDGGNNFPRTAASSSFKIEWYVASISGASVFVTLNRSGILNTNRFHNNSSFHTLYLAACALALFRCLAFVVSVDFTDSTKYGSTCAQRVSQSVIKSKTPLFFYQQFFKFLHSIFFNG